MFKDDRCPRRWIANKTDVPRRQKAKKIDILKDVYRCLIRRQLYLYILLKGVKVQCKPISLSTLKLIVRETIQRKIDGQKDR